jgi:bifunctional UDP-N-acetylglucosamine pyrophosphorylase / glucosamine-1-phosphate N-acetyltransferase
VKNEYYITDALGIVITDGHKVIAVTAVSPEEVIGVNSRKQLSECSKIMQKRVQDWFMDNGVTIVDPPNTWIDARVEIGQDSVIEPFTCIYGKVKIGSNCRVGPFVCLNDGAVIEDGSTTGVFKDISKYP